MGVYTCWLLRAERGGASAGSRTSDLTLVVLLLVQQERCLKSGTWVLCTWSLAL